jgi:hypothetical protein
MEKQIRVLWNSFIVIFVVTAFLTLGGICYIWFINRGVKLPFLQSLYKMLIVETVFVVFAFAKSSISSLPKTKVYKNEQDVNKFLGEFALRGSSVEFVSNRASWISSDDKLKEKLSNKSKNGHSVTFMTTNKPNNTKKMEEEGVKFISLEEDSYIPNARFTLINSSRQGSEELAIAVGTFPAHTVYVFNGKNAPHLIAMAKDIISLMKVNGRKDI